MKSVVICILLSVLSVVHGANPGATASLDIGVAQ